jgi:hypothetical protein
MHYLNDLALTGMDGENCLRLFYPHRTQTIHCIDRDLPRWARMLQDGPIACCFAVAVDKCLVRSGPGGLMCRNQEKTKVSVTWPNQNNLLSTTINLQEKPTVKLPLTQGVILKLESGRLTMSSGHREGHAQLATFSVSWWQPDTDFNTELLNLEGSTGLWVDVCISD